jgi:predicted lipoprotein with Yx(FWY)xxD motif
MSGIRVVHGMKVLLATSGLAAILVLAGCGGGSKPPATTTFAGVKDPATRFSVVKVSGVGDVVVDGKGRTVYILTSGAKKNVPCTDASGCTAVWPDLPLPNGKSAATAGSGLDGSLLGTQVANGETYPTYNGYLLYEYSGDTAAGQANGQGLKSYGGTWYVLDSSGQPVKSSGSGGGGYGY